MKRFSEISEFTMPGKPGEKPTPKVTSTEPKAGRPPNPPPSPMEKSKASVPSQPEPSKGEKDDPSAKPVSWNEISDLRHHLDALWHKLGIDINFTKHFMDRVNDPRNKKQITIAELSKIFIDTYREHGAQIAQKVKPESDKAFDALLTDLSTKVNMPFALEWDKKARELKLNIKTVMRVGHFYAHPGQQRLVVQHYEHNPETIMNNKQKTYTDLVEWIGFNTPEVAPIAALQAVDDVDSAAFAVEKPEILDKLNAYCHEIANHQYMNPYYPLNSLWKKLMLVGINFNLKAIMLIGDQGQVKVPITRFGGRYGYLNHDKQHDGHDHDDQVICHDDGTGIPGGLVLSVIWHKTGGVYSLNVAIEHGATVLGMGEDTTDLKKKVTTEALAQLSPQKSKGYFHQEIRSKSGSSVKITASSPAGPFNVRLYHGFGEKFGNKHSAEKTLAGAHSWAAKQLGLNHVNEGEIDTVVPKTVVPNVATSDPLFTE
jgi:hypothetical protein